MTAVRIFTDEDIYAAIAPTLRRRGIDAVSTPEVGRIQQTDESQLTWAAQQQRVLVTFNVAHFAALHTAWLRAGVHHAGIIVSNQRGLGDLLRRLLHLASTLDAAACRDRLEFLSDW